MVAILKTKTTFAAVSLLLASLSATAAPKLWEMVESLARPSAKERAFAPSTTYQVCFVPDGASCEKLLISSINNATKSIRVQAYSFTSAPIAEALVKAHRRNVKIEVILDASQETERYSGATFLANAGVPVAIDYKPAISHNKIMIFDGASVFTGSFNFSKSAESRNAENGLVIRGDANLVKAYNDNWDARFKQTRAYTGPKGKAAANRKE